MKNKIIASVAALLLASLSGTQAHTTIAAWTFDNLPVLAPTLSPAPSTDNSVTLPSASSIGMGTYASPGVGVNTPDVLLGKSSDTGGNGIADTTQIWRIRATGGGNGWSSAAPVGVQGAQFNVDTTGYDNGPVQVSFDWYATTQGEANLQLQYTTDGSTWINIPITIPPSESGLGLVVVDNSGGSDVNSVTGSYVSNNLLINGSPSGQDWFTNLTATITDPNAVGNPNFGIRMVNASTGAACVSTQGSALNNSSGNWRFDNIIISGTPGGSGASTPPTVSPATVATVDDPFTNTFTDTLSWHNAITSIKVNGTTLSAGYAVSASHVIFTPAASMPARLLQTSGSLNISIFASGYTPAQVIQYVAPGAAKQLSIKTQPEAPTGNGGTLVTQPLLAVLDQYNNIATNCSATYVATNSSGWSFGTGSAAVQVLTDGTVTFTNLSATSPAAVSGATIIFKASSSTGLGGLSSTTTNSSAFDIPAPATAGFTPGNLAVLQVDKSANNSTFSILELSPSGYLSSPVNTFPVTATGTNAMRISNSSSTGRLSTSADGALLCFAGFLDGDSTTADETTITNRGAGTLDPSGNYVLQATYVGVSSDQARSATSLDNDSFYMGDKGGVYTNDNYVVVSGTGANVRPLKCFGGKIYTMTQAGSTQPTVLLMNYVDGNSLYPLNGFPVEPLATDFYMIASGQHGRTNDILYYIDGTNTTSGAIFKFCLSYDPANDDVNGQQGWVSAGSSSLLINGGVLNSAPTPDGGDGLCAATNASGGVDLYYTTGTGGTVSNSLVKVTDSAGYNQPISLGSFQTLYTTRSNAILKGVAFAPVAHTLAGSLSGGRFTLRFTTVTGLSFSVLSTNNLAAPRANWPVVGTAVESPAGSGIYQYTNPAPTGAQQFYLIRQP